MRRQRPVDDPLFGRAEPCECILAEAAEVRRDRLERLSNLGQLTRFTFEGLARNDRGSAFDEALGVARSYAGEPTGWLVLTGPSGSGKTHLAAAIANERIGQGKPALFMVVPDLLDHLRASQEPQEDELGYHQMFEQVRSHPFLVLDEMDGAAGTPWAREKLFQIVNHRYNAELPTVFTASLLRQLDDRLVTRLSNSRLSRVVSLEPPSQPGYEQVGGMTRERLAEHQFRNFDVRPARTAPEERESLQGALRAAQHFAEDPRGWLLLMGNNGCGKTHLAAAIANRCLASGRSVFFAVVPDLLDHLRASFAPGKDTGYDELFDHIRNAGVLILDDFGAQASTEWAVEKLYQVVNYRTVAGLPAVVTTDRGTAELQAAHPRIMARLLDPTAGNSFWINAGHYRLGRLPAGEQRQPRHSR